MSLRICYVASACECGKDTVDQCLGGLEPPLTAFKVTASEQFGRKQEACGEVQNYAQPIQVVIVTQVHRPTALLLSLRFGPLLTAPITSIWKFTQWPYQKMSILH